MYSFQNNSPFMVEITTTKERFVHTYILGDFQLMVYIFQPPWKSWDKQFYFV